MLVNFLRSGRTLLFLMGVAFGFVAVARAQAPAISKQPVSVTVVAGNPASFSVVATGAAPLSYQWRKDGNVIPVATGPTLSFLAATGADAGVYRVTVTSLAISVTSDTVTLTVNLPPTITTQPLAQTTTLGGAVTLRVVATGMGILTYQWYRNGETLAEATGASYNIPSASAADAGAYTVQIGNSFGQVTSVPAQVGFSGMLWAVGFNANGALGDGTTTNRVLPVPVATGVRTVVAGNGHNFILRVDGSLWAMGRNDRGQLGDGTTTNRLTAVPIASGVSTVATYNLHTLFLGTDGTLWAMGNNASGQLGDGTMTIRPSPVQVATGVSAVAAGDGHSLYVKTDATLWAMGNNANGQLGDGTPTTRLSPVQVATGVSAVAAGESHSLYVKTDGTLWAMGNNASGQLGDGTTTNRPSPVQVAADVTAVAARAGSSYFLKTDGTLRAMGNNAFGQLGDSTAISRPSPVRIATSVKAVAAGIVHSFFLQTDGTLWAMGNNTYGQLGNGTTISRGLPVQVASGVTAMAAGEGQGAFTQISGFGTSPVISDSPLGGAFAVGASTTLSVNVSGSGPLDYQWQKNGAAIAGGRSPTLVFTALAATDAGRYAVVVTNSAGSVTSGVANLSIDTPPAITVQPAATTVNDGSSTSFSVQATGSDPLRYQWYKDGISISGATKATYTIAAAAPGNAGSYLVTVSNPFDAVTSTSAVLTVNPVFGPTISVPPFSASTTTGSTATFEVIATGTGPFTYQWRKDGVPIAGATNATHTLASVQKSDVGSYTVSVVNRAGSVTSAAATLTVAVFDPGRLINLSILTQLAAGETMTLGAVLGGAGTSGGKPLLVRAVGPSLSQFGVTAVLADPTFDLFSGQTVVAANDNWGGTAELSNAYAQVGAFAFTAATSRDAAIFSRALNAGNYTARISGVGGAGGRVLAEIYDATVNGTLTSATPRLVNISVLKQINVGDVLTAGFVIGGSTPKTVLLRAIGPPLADAPFYVAGVMADPTLRLYSGQNAISSNDDWGAGALASALASAFTRVGAFPLRADSADAALLVTLQPGNYTAQISGAGGTGGVALVEVYEVP
jgi:alpha-tubulin suppressor-like RCC1 family protein